MALIDIICDNDHEHEVQRAAADWPACPPCPTCALPTRQWPGRKRTYTQVEPVVVYKSPDGSYRFPGDRTGQSAASYQQQGFERVEIRGAAEMRRFERAMNRHEYSRASRKVEAQHRQREEREAVSRSELRSRMQSMSTAGRTLARAAMARNDNKPRPKAHDANFHNEAYSFDRSNRETSRDERGHRRRD